MTRKIKLPNEVVEQIRKAVQGGKSKYKVSQELTIPYKRILKYTKDIPADRGIPIELRKRIRQEVIAGKSKRRVAMELDVSESTVQYYTKDMCLTPFRKLNIPDKKLELMKDLLQDGYAFASERYGSQEYNRLKEHFPNISKVKMHDKVIFFLEGNENIATEAFLNTTSKRIISYQELKQVTDVFGADLNNSEKKAVLGRNQEKIKRKMRGFQNTSKSILKEAQEKIDDFLGRFLHSGLLSLQ